VEFCIFVSLDVAPATYKPSLQIRPVNTISLFSVVQKNSKSESLKYDFNCVLCKVNDTPMKARKGGGGVAPSFSQPGTILARVVSTMLRQLYPQDRLGTPCTEGWLGFGAALD